MKVFLAVLTIIGTVIGSGFMSGKEIVVFFSRFGILSFPSIILASLLFYLFFRYFLSDGHNISSKLEKSKLCFFCNIIISIIISSAMFAGSIESMQNYNSFWIIFILLLIIIFSIYITQKGIGGLGKTNFVMVPFMVVILVFGLISLINFNDKTLFVGNGFSIFSPIYTVLYVFFNISTSIIVISNIGQSLSEKQRMRVAFLSALALCIILLLANVVLLQNVHAFGQDMPLLSMFFGWKKVFMQIVILLGCVTTLFSLVFTSSNCLRGLCKSQIFIIFISVLLPFALSFFGFGNIVLYLYPLSSVLSVFLLVDLLVVPLFKRTYAKIHSGSKNTK